MSKNDIVTVYRYVRAPSTHQSNLYGVTIRFDVNYVTGHIQAKLAFCNGDNFSKAIGRVMADKSECVFDYNMPTDPEGKFYVSSCGLVEMLLSVLISAEILDIGGTFAYDDGDFDYSVQYGDVPFSELVTMGDRTPNVAQVMIRGATLVTQDGLTEFIPDTLARGRNFSYIEKKYRGAILGMAIRILINAKREHDGKAYEVQFNADYIEKLTNE